MTIVLPVTLVVLLGLAPTALVAAPAGAPDHPLLSPGAVQEPGRAATAQLVTGEVVAEVRIHGNHTTPDAEVLRLAGVTPGQVLGPTTAQEAVRRLRASGLFEEVEIRKRYRSLSDLSQVSLVFVVREHPVPDVVLEQTPAVLRPVKRLWSSGMFLPVLQYADGYGFTYGARVSFVHSLGRDGRVSIPMTWGGTKRIAVEVDKRVSTGPVDRVVGGAGLSRRTNPHFDLDEDRRDAWVGASRRIVGGLRAGLEGGLARIGFGDLEERVTRYGADLSLDTRHDPVFPRNAIFAAASWEVLDPSVSARANRYRLDARAYRGVVGQTVLSVRWQYDGSDGPLPPYAKALLGGAGTLRGYRAGHEAGDNLMAVSAELRVPLSSPLGIGRAGFSVFADTGTVWDHGSALGDSRFRKGAGGGVFVLASVFQLNADVAVREGGGVRLHVSTGLQF